MRTRNWAGWAIGIGAVMVGCVAFGAGVTLPYAEDFESLDANWYTNNLQSDASIASETGITGSGYGVTNVDLILPIDDSDSTNVWMQVYARPSFGETNQSDLTSAEGGFFVSTNSHVWAWTGAWARVTSSPLASTNNWFCFVVHADTTVGRWDLYLKTQAQYGTSTLTRIAANLDMASGAAATAITNWTVRGGAGAKVDQVAVSPSFRDVNEYTDLAILPLETSDVSDFAVTLPVYDEGYTSAGENLLTGAIGKDLATGLSTATPDKLRVYTTNGAWSVYQWTATGWQVDGTPLPIAQLEIGAFTALRYLRDASPDLAYCFLPYNTAIAVNGDATGSGASESIVLNGADAGSGWSDIIYPKDTTVATIELNSGAALSSGDRMLVFSTTNPRRYTEYVWNGSAWTLWGSSVATAIPGGSRCLFKRASNGYYTESITY